MAYIDWVRKAEIERAVQRLLDATRRRREECAGRTLSDFELPPTDPMEAAAHAGLRIAEVEEFPGTQIIGELYRPGRRVSIAVGNCSPERRRYTVAHELGHFCVHQGMVHHREEPGKGRSTEELEADYFAACLLMPAGSLRARFERYFGGLLDWRHIDEDTAYRLGAGGLRPSQVAAMGHHGFAKLVARTTSFSGRQFECLAEVFGVSVESMAYRLEELNLIL